MMTTMNEAIQELQSNQLHGGTMGCEEKIFVTAYLQGSNAGSIDEATMVEVNDARKQWRNSDWQ